MVKIRKCLLDRRFPDFFDIFYEKSVIGSEIDNDNRKMI